MSENPNGEHPPEHPQADAIRGELQRVLQSHAFRTSKRSQSFLSYVVEHAITGRTDAIKERTIGVAVFDRSPSYDTGEDATVRVAANEVRKRLGQYQSESPGREVRIELPLGAYVPEFHVASNGDTVAPEAAGREEKRRETSGVRWRLWLGAAAAVPLLAWGAISLLGTYPSTPFDEFWKPMTGTGKPVLICLAHPRMHHVMGRLQNEYKSKGYNDAPATKTEGKAVTVELQPGDIVQTEQYVGSGDAYAAGLFSALLTKMKQPILLRIGNDVSFADLRSSPAVLIGAYSNRWTMQSNAEYRFGFGRHSVVEHGGEGREWKVQDVAPDYRSPEDYVIVSRVLQSYSGEPVVLAAGTTNMGTRAGAEFLTNPSYLNQALAQAPPGWQKKNMQLVLHCRGIGLTPGPPKVIAAHYW